MLFKPKRVGTLMIPTKSAKIAKIAKISYALSRSASRTIYLVNLHLCKPVGSIFHCMPPAVAIYNLYVGETERPISTLFSLVIQLHLVYVY